MGTEAPTLLRCSSRSPTPASLLQVWLTDLDSHVEIMRTNAARNAGACAAACDVRVEAYDWAESAAHLDPPFDCILGTDLAYNPALYRPVVAALKVSC